METVYENNDCKITVNRVDEFECKVDVNGKNLIWISVEQKEEFIHDIQSVLDKYRI